jgi:DNA-directed RNA polymerase specialized sigma24 family protein
LTQEFFAQLLAKQLLHAVDPTKGRFRSWLLGVMKHFLAHEWTKSRAQKRGGGRAMFSLDELDAENRYRYEPVEDGDCERVFDRRWAYTVLDRAAARLRKQYEDSGRADFYNALKGFVWMDEASACHEEAGLRLNMTASALKSAVHRLRQRYQGLIREEIAQTVTTSSEVDEEIRYLLAVIRRG